MTIILGDILGNILGQTGVFLHELSGCGFESSCSHLNFRFRVCFEQGVP